MKTMCSIQIHADLQQASVLLRQLLEQTFKYDTAAHMVTELQRHGFSPMTETHIDAEEVPIWIIDPNLGLIKISYTQTDVCIH
jgi:hypothetical protein